MTKEEYIEYCIREFEKDPKADTIENMVALAYMLGREDEAAEDIRLHNSIIAAQKKRAEDHRFKNYGAYIVGSSNETFIYSKYYNKKKNRNHYGLMPTRFTKEDF